MLYIDRMRHIAQELYQVRIDALTAGAGTPVLRSMIQVLGIMHSIHDFSSREEPFYVVQKLPDASNNFLENTEGTQRINNYEDLLLKIQNTNICEILGADNFDIGKKNICPKTSSQDVLIYKYYNRIESFFVNGEEIPLYCIQNNSPSFFSRATFMELDEALAIYKQQEVRHSTCYILNQIWTCPNRILLKTSPEEIMRKSLEQFLRQRVRGVDVRPEHNVNESEPVDIKVTWDFSTDRALIEIKWLGKCGESSTNYSQSRAQVGAGQLARYLDEENVRSSQYHNIGYLVVIDARRKAVNNTTTNVNLTNGLYYEDKDIIYNPAFHEIRSDFKEPLRMFVEPVCTPL